MLLDQDAQILDANLIVDCDEILVNISPKWVLELYKTRHIFEEYFDFSEIEKVIDDEIAFCNLVLHRPVFYLNQWLLKDPDKPLPTEILQAFLEVFDNDEFYRDLTFTKMAIGLKRLSVHKAIKKVYVITRHSSEKNKEGKESLIKQLFPESKLEIRWVDGHHKKSDYIKDINIENGFIFEDETSNILDYLKNADNVSKCNLYVPMLGYNPPNDEVMELAEKKKVCIIGY